MDDWFDTIKSDDDDEDEIEILSELTLAQRMRRRTQKKEEEKSKVKRKRERRMWSESEIESLKAGVERYGAYQNCWSKILEDDANGSTAGYIPNSAIFLSKTDVASK